MNANSLTKESQVYIPKDQHVGLRSSSAREPDITPLTSNAEREPSKSPSPTLDSLSRSIDSADIDLAGPAIPNSLSLRTSEFNVSGTLSSQELLERSPSLEIRESTLSKGIQAPMQMTLDTSGGYWNFKPGSNNKPARKKHKSARDADVSHQLAMDQFQNFAQGSTSDDMPDADVEANLLERALSASDEIQESPASSVFDPSPDQGDVIELEMASQTPAEGAATLTSEQYSKEAGAAIQFLCSPSLDHADAFDFRTDEKKEASYETEGTLQIELASIRTRLSRTRACHIPYHEAAEPTEQSQLEPVDLEGAGVDQAVEAAQQTLSRLVSKGDFARMDVVGQVGAIRRPSSLP